MAENHPRGHEGQPREQFDQKVADGNWLAAIRAFPPEIQPRDERQVQEPGDGILTIRTMRTWVNDALFQRHPVDAHVEETADHRAEQKEDDGPKVKRDPRPKFRVKHVIKSVAQSNLPIDMLLQSGAHRFDRRFLAGPNFERLCTLV